MNDLDVRLAKLEKFAEEKAIHIINERIYKLDLSDSFLKSLSNEKIMYIHVKLHSLLIYKRFASKFDILKSLHDKVVSFLGHHPEVDRLDA